MNGKRYACVLLIFIFCLISASAVCAAENSTDDIIGSDVNDDISKTGIAKDASIANENEECALEKNDDDFSLSLSDNMSDDVVGVSTYTFKDLYNKIKDGGETTLQFNYAYNYDTDKDIIDSASGGIRLTKDLILHGNGRTIDAKNSVIHFVVYKCSLTIDNLKLVNGKETKSGTGGAIYVYSNNGDNAHLTATKCIFNNNHAQNGGAILVTDKSRLTLTRCTFTGNEATDLGGAIAISGSVQLFGREIQNCNFTNNRAKNGGGAILVQQGINDLLTFWDLYITDSYFKNNSAINSDGAGGAVYGSSSAISIENSVFSSNSAEDTGGAITALDCNRIKILSSNLTSNCVTGPDSCGGALYVQDIDALEISESNFTDNHASISGGAIHGSAKISAVFPWIVSLSNFKNNSANAAGAMTIINCHLAHISGSDFTGNNATGSNSEGGGAILAFSSNLVIDSSNFTDNHVKSIFGGAIRSLHSKGLLVDDAKFINNTVTGVGGYGGAILVSSDEGNSIPVVISKSDFLNNKAEYGGAIAISTVYNVTVVDSNFINNTASYAGSIYFIDSDCVNINGSNFTNNIGNKDGGAIYAKSSNLVIKSIFDKNLAGMGGAIYAIDSYLNVSSTFMANQGGFGGAIYTENNATISSIFINNSAFFKGGAVYGSANATDSSLTLDNSQFYNNYAQDNEGGAVFVKYMNLFVGNSYFNNNTANRGGSIFIVGKGRSYRLTVDGSQFYNNNASDLGGAIESEFIDSFIKDSLFENNSAGFRGGAISSLADDNYVLTVEDSQFYSNNAINNGGAVFVQQGNLSVDNSYFDNNTADYRGGAIFLLDNMANSASANIGNSQFYNNNALDYGGAIFATYYILSINDSDFENSHASEGGGIYAYCIPSLTITNSRLSKNSAYAGSAIVASDVPMFNILESEFFDNVESTDGAILIKGITNLNVLRSNFTNNVAIDEVGGAISLFDNSTLNVSNSIFKNNLAMMRSGAIHSHDCLININDNSLFYNNTAIRDDVGIYAREGYLSNSTFINTKFAGHFYAYQCAFINEVLFKIDYIYTVTYGTSFNVTVRDACNFNGVVNVTIGDGSYEVKLVRGVGSVTITDLPIGEYKATIYFMNPEYVPYPYYCESNVFNVKPQSYIDLAELISKAETGSVITLDRDYEFDPYYDSSLIGGIVIDKNITINGNNHVLDMKNAARMFNVTGGANLTVENLNFINAKVDDAKDEGSAIHVESGILNICNSNFTNSSGKLGAVYISKDSAANIINSTFTDNHAVEGGAIWIGGDDAYVSECVFVANTASQGGAIWVGGDDAYVGECVFAANTASEGGAVYSEVDGTRVDTCHFNTSSDTFNDHVTVLQPVLTMNDFAVVHYSGDNITFSIKTHEGKTLTNRVISIDVFDENGDSFKNYSILSEDCWTVDLPVGTYLVNCSAADFADVSVNVILYIYEKGVSTFAVLNRTINGCSDLEINLTEDYVFNPIVDAAFKDGIVIDRPVTINANGHRIDGAHQARIFCVDADDVTLNDVVFVNGNASYGGALYWAGGDNGEVCNCQFVNNAASEGGAIYSEVDGTCADTCYFNTSSDTCNAHVTVLQPTLTINDFALVYNFGDNITFSLKTRSGRILTNMVISIEVFDENGTSYQNNSILSGGRWTVELPVGYYTVNCSAADFADANVNVALYIFEKGIGSFRDLNRVINGGNDLVIDLTEDYVFHSLLDNAFKEGIVINRPVTINGNGHRIDGAHQARIFHVDADDVTINDVVFVNGNASYGGALYWAGGDNGEVCNCQFVNNTASEGGAIYSEVNGTCADSCYFNTGSDTYNDYVVTFLPNLTADNFTIPYNSGYKLPVFITAHCGRIITDRIMSMNVFYENNTFYQSYSFLSGDSWMVDLPVGSYYAVISTDSVASSPVQVAITVIPNTFTGLDNLVNGHDYSEIYLNGDYVFDSSVDNGFTEGVTISKPVTIYGNGHIIDGKGEVRLFNVKADNVTFINLTFINGFANVYSGAVKGKSLAINCSFINNTGDYGGAMFEGAAIGSVFINNSARYGGAIQSLVVTNCTFIGNHANTGAGVGYAMMGYASSVAYNCTFINNYAPDTGGMQGDAYNCTFIGNHADDGTVGALSGNAYNCTFIENYARGDGFKGSYGAMSGNAYNCTFIENYAIQDGGAIGGYAYNCTFIENYAGRNGGAMHYGHAYNCTFSGNHADKDGGAIWDTWISPDVCAVDCYFIGNYARDGGAVLAGIVNSSTFINNSARRMGGATYLTITNNCTFSGNTQPVVLSFKDLNETINSNNDSDIYLEYYFVYNGEIDSDFTDGIEINRDVVIHGNGHIIDGNERVRIFKVAEGVKVIFKDISFENGHDTFDGGAIIGQDFTAINCTFMNNFALFRGAAMHGGCAINCTFINNQGYYGTGVYNGTAINCIFIDNTGEVIRDSTADSCIFINGIVTENTVILHPVLHISNLTVAYGAGENLTFYLTTNSGMPLDNVNVTMDVFYINGTFYKSYSFLSGEKWNIDLLGSYFAVCDIDVYDMDPVNVTIDVKIPTVISADEVITPYKVNRNLVIALKSDKGTPIGGMNVTVSGLDGVKVYRTDANGEIQIPTGDLAPKTYDVEIIFRETDIHYASSTATRVYIQEIIPVLQVSNLTVAYTAGGNLTFSLTNRSGMPLDYVNITMDVFYRNGTFYNNYSFLNGDVWNVDLPIGSYYGICDIDIYDMDPVKVTIEIKIPTAVVSSGEIITPYKVNRNLVIVLKDDNATPISGMNVTVSGLNGVKVYSTDANGEIQIPTVDLAPKAYDVQVSFMGSDIYFASSTATKIYIQEPTQIKSAPLTTVYNSYKYLVTPILDSKGKPLKNEAINITINGVTYSCKSNNDGNAMLTIRLKPKTYTATVAFAGNEKYTPATQVVKVIVKKATPKITAKKKTFKRKVKTKKYTVVLKDNNKNPMAKVKLTLKIKKKTYKAKTNKKGKATFKIKKLTKKGKYKAVIKYKGNGCYKAVSKKVQIKLK